MPSPPPVAFRPLTSHDLPLIRSWLADPEVAAWWRESDLSLEAIIGKYQPLIDGTERVLAYIFLIQGISAGFIQAYRIEDHPTYARQIELPPGSVATDLFLGESSLRGKGWGGVILREFLAEIVFGELGAAVAVIAPEPTNARAIHVYEQAGFRWLKTVSIVDGDNPLDSGDEYVMVMPAAAFESAHRDARRVTPGAEDT
jgi:aminoglycoside 6'-N-acetyltransferase